MDIVKAEVARGMLVFVDSRGDIWRVKMELDGFPLIEKLDTARGLQVDAEGGKHIVLPPQYL